MIKAHLHGGFRYIRQSEAGECGLACLAMIASHYGSQLELGQLRRMFPLSSRGATFKALIGIADDLALTSRAVKSEVSAVQNLNLPAILHWDLNHFVVLRRVSSTRRGIIYHIADPAAGEQKLAEADFSRHFTGIVLEVAPSAGFKPQDTRLQLRLNQLWSRMDGLWGALGRILLLSAVLQAAALTSPLFMQIAIDKVLPTGDRDLLFVLALGFAGVLLIQCVSTWLRNVLAITLSNSLALQMAVNLFRHTVHLPISWFEKRHLGDIVSRFGSLQPITDLLSRGLVGSIIDGVLMVGALLMMLFYSPVLVLVTSIAMLAYGAVKAFSFHFLKTQNVNLLSAQAMENSTFIESVRGIAPIKTFGQEANRQRVWLNRKTEYVNANIKMTYMTATFDVLSFFVLGLETLVFISVATNMALAGKISLGMIFAFQSYKLSFTGGVSRLIDQLISYRLLDVHLSRLADIALAKPEADDSEAGAPPLQTLPRIECRNVSFSYGRGLPFVLKDVNLVIEPGRTTAIVGVSGAGKTTLLKILAGLLEPTFGAILVDGVPLSDYGLRNYRRLLGVVTQDDMLFAGSLVENISFFDPDYDQAHVIDCATRAAIHNDIMAMPAKYETPVGDMGSNLSGGQKQRLLLARALYKFPKVLLLDEGTSHLDVGTEADVNAFIKSLSLSRVLVAHRQETIRLADVIYEVRGGQVFPFNAPQPMDKALAQ